MKKLRKLDSKLLMLSLVLPGAVHALGLGKIHIASALGDPLVGRIDIIGASPQELAGLRAVIASDAIFQRYGVDRPRFLATTALKISQDRRGRPIILVQSQQPVVEPLVNLLVDLQSMNGELVREYTVLLDPPGYGAASRDRLQSPRKTQTRRPARTTQRAQPAPTSPIITTYTVSPQDTLSRIVRLSGATSMADERRMMIAVFRDNPGAFAGNLNLLRAGATLHLPTPAEVAAIRSGAAQREFAAQMQAWHAARHALPKPSAQVAPAATIADLNRQIVSLQQSIAAVRQQLQQPLVLPTPRQPATAPVMPVIAPTLAPAPVSAAPPKSASTRVWRWRFVPLAAGLALVAAALAAWLARWRARAPQPLPVAEVQQRPEVPDVPEEAAVTPQLPAQQRVASGDTTVQLAPPVSDFADVTSILEPPVDLSEETAEHLLKTYDPERSINTTHVRLSSALHEQREFVERRKSPADVLRQAIEREPERSDLRLKLLELYYTAAAENRRAFLEVARRLAKRNGLISAEEWAQISSMGREIAAQDSLFADADVTGDDIADCA